MAEGSITLSLNHHLVDTINLVGILLGILGFLYLTYEFFGRGPLKWVIRVITPSLVGVVILVPAGIGVYLYFFGFTGLVFRGALTYGLVGVLIGTFNGIFVDWPSSLQKPPIFSWRGYSTGFLLSFSGWFVVSLSIWPNFITAFVEAGIVAVIGGFAGGLWYFLNWEPFLSSNQAYLFSWQGCCIGIILAFLFGFAADLILGYPTAISILEGCILIPTGGIIGSLWYFFRKKQPSSVTILRPPLTTNSLTRGKHNNTEQNDSISIQEATKNNILISEIWFANYVLSKKESSFDKTLSLLKRETNLIQQSIPEMELTKEGIWAPKGTYKSTNLSEEVIPFISKAPLFSWKGCLIGLIVAFSFGLIWAAVGNITFNTLALGVSFMTALPVSLRGAITAAAFIGPGGAITGGISRFIFWRANSLRDGQLGGIGAIITLIGFFLQLLPLLISLLNIPVQ
jgi:hypothetical protein